MRTRQGLEPNLGLSEALYPAKAMLDMGAATARGVTRGTLGLPGDLESLMHMIVGGNQTLPTSEDFDKKLTKGTYLSAPDTKQRSPFDDLGVFYNVPIYGGALNTATKTIPKAIDTFTRPKVTNSIYSMMPGAPLRDTKYVQRNINGPDEIDDILSSGFMLPKKGGKNQKYFTATNEVNTNSSGKNVVRIDRSKVPANRAVRAKDVELFNRETNTWEPITKKFMGKDVLENPGRREFAKKAGAIGLGSTALAKAIKYLDELEKATPIAKEVEDVAPAAKAATKYKYNSLKEYADDLNVRSREGYSSTFPQENTGYLDNVKAQLAKSDEEAYNLEKAHINSSLIPEDEPYTVLHNFSPQAKAEMKAFKEQADNWSYSKAESQADAMEGFGWNTSKEYDSFIDNIRDNSHWTDFLDDYVKNFK